MKTPVTLVLCLFASLRAFAASFSANPTADAFVTTGPSGNLSGNNYGGGGALSVAAPGLAQGEFQSVMQFNLSAARNAFDSLFGPGQWSISSVTLQLNASPVNNAIFNSPAAGQLGIAWMQNDSWVEGSGTPGAPGATGISYTSLQNTFIGPSDQNLGTFSFNGATSGAFTYSLSLSSGITGDALAGDNLSLRLFAADSSLSGIFNSRGFPTVANRPLLTIEAVPEPRTIVLAAAGLLLLIGSRLRGCVNNHFKCIVAKSSDEQTTALHINGKMVESSLNAGQRDGLL